jgi:hypothetical protein
MSWIVTPNLITLNTADNITNWVAAGTTLSTATALETDISIQGSGSISWGTKSIGPHFLFYSSSTVDMRNQHFYIWFQSAAAKTLDTFANKGVGVILSLGGAFSLANTAIWAVDGNDTYPGGWKCYVIDCNKAPDYAGAGWTATALQNVQKFGMLVSCSSTPVRSGIPNQFIDVIRYGSGLTIYSGSAANPATFESLYFTDALETVGTASKNKFGVVDKRGGVYFLQGAITIGSGSETTYFNDTDQIVQFETYLVSESLYKITVTGSKTTCSFGTLIGSGESAIGVDPIILRGAEDLKRKSPTGGPASYTQSLRPVFYVSPEVKRFNMYGSRIADFKEVNFGIESIPMNGTNLQLVDNSFSNTFPITSNISPPASLLLNNKIISTTGSLAGVGSFLDPRQSFAIKLVTTTSMDGTQISVLNSFGFTSTGSSVAEVYTLTNQPFTSNTKYLTVYPNKTWDVINPTWTVPITTQSLVFVTSASNFVNERYSYDTTIVDPTGTVISGSKVYIYEGTLTDSVLYTTTAATGTGLASTNVTKTTYTPTGSTTNPSSSILSSSYGGFSNKVYQYGYSPYAASIVFTAPVIQTLALVTDTNITDPNQATARTNGATVVVSKFSGSFNPVKVIKYLSGSTSFVSGSPVTGSSSGATGVVIEFLGDSVEGTVVLAKGNSIPFSNFEALRNGATSYATSSVLSSLGGFSGSYTWMIDCANSPLTTAYDYLAAQMATIPIASTFNDVLIWGQGTQTQLMYVGTSGYFTNRNRNQGVWVAKKGAGTIAFLTSNEGYSYVPPVQYTLTLTGLIADSEVRIFVTGSENGAMGQELTGIESSGTSFSYSYIYQSDIYVDIVVINVGYEYLRVSNILVSNANSSIPIQQRIDRNYRNP